MHLNSQIFSGDLIEQSEILKFLTGLALSKTAYIDQFKFEASLSETNYFN